MGSALAMATSPRSAPGSSSPEARSGGRLHIHGIKEMPAGYDAEVAELFRDLRAASGMSETDLAAQLATRLEVVQALEQGAIYALPPWPETCRVVSTYGTLLNLGCASPAAAHLCASRSRHRRACAKADAGCSLHGASPRWNARCPHGAAAPGPRLAEPFPAGPRAAPPQPRAPQPMPDRAEAKRRNPASSRRASPGTPPPRVMAPPPQPQQRPPQPSAGHARSA